MGGARAVDSEPSGRASNMSCGEGIRGRAGLGWTWGTLSVVIGSTGHQVISIFGEEQKK